MSRKEKKKRHFLKDLTVNSVHLVVEPAVPAAHFLIKKAKKGGSEMSDLHKEAQAELNEEKAIESKMQQPQEEVEKAKKKTFLDVARDFVEKIKGFEDVPPKLMKLVDKIEEFLDDYAYGYPEPAAKGVEVIEKYKQEISELKAKVWEYEMISKGKPPATVKKLVEIIKKNEDLIPIVNELIDAIPSVPVGQVAEQTQSNPITQLQEKVEKIAKICNW